MSNIKDSMTNALKDNNNKLRIKLRICKQNFPSNVADEALKDKVVNVFKLLNIDIKK